MTLALAAAAMPSMPNVYAATTTTISENTAMGVATIEAEDTVIIEQGATLSMTSVTNKGIIINHGTIALGPFSVLVNDGGAITNTGLMDFGLADLINKNGGTIRNENGASMTFRQAGSPVGHVFENGAGSTVTNSGPISLDDVFGLVNDGQFVNECGGSLLVRGPSSGNAIVDKCTEPRENADLQIKSIDLSGNAITGMWTTIRSIPDGKVIQAGFTPMTFTGIAGFSYQITVSNYDGRIFSNWENGSGGNSRQVNLVTNTTITAAYDVGDSMRGFSSLTFTGTAEQPDLTVNALTIDGSRSLHMWTIIDPQSNGPSGTTYKILVHSYKDRQFDHWEDGSTSRIRNLTTGENTAITAYYRTQDS